MLKGVYMITVYDRERIEKNVGGNEITLDT